MATALDNGAQAIRKDREMTNPFQQHRCALFAERESIDAALHYVHEVLNTLDGADKAAALTAMMVLVNTAAKVWPEAPESEDAAQVRAALAARAADALPLDQLVAHQLGERIVDLDAQMVALADRIASLEEWMVPVVPPVEVALDKRITDLDARLSVLEVAPVTPEDVAKAVEAWADENLDGYIESWADTYLDDRMESWASDNLDLDDRVETWMENNLDIENEVRQQLRSASLSIEF